MTTVTIDLQDVGESPGPRDRVVFWSPVFRGDGGRVITPAEKSVDLVGGVGSTTLVPGPVVVQILCDAVADTKPKPAVVPASGTITLRQLLEDSFEYSPEIVSAVRSLMVRAEAAASAAEADQVQTGKDRVQTGKDRVQTGLDRTAAAGSATLAGTRADTAGGHAQAAATDRTQTGLDRVAAAQSAQGADASERAAAGHLAEIEPLAQGVEDAVPVVTEAASTAVTAAGTATEQAGFAEAAAEQAVPAAEAATTAAEATEADRVLSVDASAAAVTAAQIISHHDHYAGQGFPNGSVSAPVGSIYTDTAATAGAIRWIKTSGTGNTGWEVEYGDTGWRDISGDILVPVRTGARVYIRRTGIHVYLSADVLHFEETVPATTPFLAVPSGFRAIKTYRNSGAYEAGAVYTALAGTELALRAAQVGSSRFYINYLTDNPWPTSLPGTPS